MSKLVARFNCAIKGMFLMALERNLIFLFFKCHFVAWQELAVILPNWEAIS